MFLNVLKGIMAKITKITCKICGGCSKLFFVDLFDDRYGAPGKYSIYRCTNCGFGQTQPRLKEDEISGFYTGYYPLASVTPASVKSQAKILPPWLRRLSGVNNIAHYYVWPGAKVLDIGSASGVSLLEIEKLGSKAYGVEPDSNARQLAQKLNLAVFIGQISENPFPKEKFGIVTATQVIEHIPNPKQFLLDIEKKLSSDGVIILSFPNLDALSRKLFGRRWLHWHVPYHQNFFTRQAIFESAESTGLKILKLKTITPNPWSIMQIQMLIKRTTEGEMHPLWAAQHNKNQKKLSKIAGLFNFLASYCLTLFLILPNRLIDAFGQGESFIVWLKREGND